MKQGFKLIIVLLMTVLLAVSATAQVNWLKQDGNVKYLAWDNGSNSKTIYHGKTAAFTTGYFGSTISQTVKLTATINNKDDGKMVSTLVSKNVNVADSLGYEIITVLPEHYKNKAGEYIIVIKIKDANSEQVDTSLYLEVKPSLIYEIKPIPVPIDLNDAPKMGNLDDKGVKENNNLQFTVSATDPDNDDLTFEAKACLKLRSNCLWSPVGIFGASFNEETGAFSWTPSYDFVKHPSWSRSIDFRFRAVDEHHKKSAWEQITVTVNDKNRNPKFDPIANKVAQEEQLLKFTVSATDADNDRLVYSIISKPAGASFDPESGLFKWVPTNTQAGLYSVIFKVVDGFGAKDLERILIQVTDLPAEEPQCDDGSDNDRDSLVDENDPGCHADGNPNNRGSYDPTDNDETDEPAEERKPQCKDGLDNDRDRKTDFPSDPGCANQDDDEESDDPEGKPQCDDNVDNDRDGKTDYPADPGCSNGNDDDETDGPVEEEPQCNEGIDNDDDTLVDLRDPGCENNPEDDDESNTDGSPQPETVSYTNIKFKTAQVEDLSVTAGELMAVHAAIFNNGKTDLKDVEVQATIYEIGAFGSTSDFNLLIGKGVDKSIYVHIPEEAQPGWYLVKITAKNYHYHTSTYRLVHVGNNTFQ